MHQVSVSRVLDAPAGIIWSAVTTPHAFVHVARGMLRYPAAERVGRAWRVGDELVGWTLLFGLVPFSRHRLVVESIDHEQKVLVSDEGGGPIRTWRHAITVTPLGERRCRYEDHIEIDAGPLTGAVTVYARIFYRYRQRRWSSLAPLLAAVEAAHSPTAHPSSGA